MRLADARLLRSFADLDGFIDVAADVCLASAAMSAALGLRRFTFGEFGAECVFSFNAGIPSDIYNKPKTPHKFKGLEHDADYSV